MSQPFVIGVPISPLRRGTPAKSVDTLVAETDASIRAGAGIIYHPRPAPRGARGNRTAAGMSSLSNAEMVNAAVQLAETAGRTVVRGADALGALIGGAAAVSPHTGSSNGGA